MENVNHGNVIIFLQRGGVIMNRIAEINRFDVVSDKGKKYTIIESQTYLAAGSQGNPQLEIPGLKEFNTTTGLAVNYIDPKTFMIVETGETVRKS